jgi:hypothetical protein
MSLFFWIALGTTLAALLLRWILRSRLKEEQAWKKFVDSNATPYVFQSKDRRDTDAHPNPQGEGMNTPTRMPTSRSPHDGDLRRSSRIDRPVPLLILGTNRRGETFQEKTSAVSVNLHGCRYPSRHDYAPESWVTLQVTGTDGGDSPVVRARVRSVLSPQTPREFCQVGVELETPGNVWGIPAQPEDWQRILVASNSGARVAAAVAPALDPSTPLSSFLGKQSAPSERRAEVTVFPGPPAAAAPAAEVAPAKEPEATKAARVVITLERLLQALQGRIQLAADKAVQTSLSTQLDQAVKIALAKIDDGWRANVSQTGEFSAARLAEVQNHLEKELVVYRSRAEEISRRLEALAGNSQQTLAESQKFVESFANETAPKLHARLNASLDRAIGEFEARAAQVSGRHLTQLVESTQLAAREARSHLNESITEVHSLLSTAGGGVSQERVESLIDSSREQTLSRLEGRLGELHTGFEQQHDVARQRTDEIARQLESLAAETCQTHSQHEQALSEVRSLLANMNAAVPQERLDSLLNSSRAQILSDPEWRLGEIFGHDEQLVGQARNRADELAQQVERPSTETRDYLAEIRSLIDRASRELRPQNLSAIEQSVGHATKEFETAAARVSDRQLVRLMEQKQAVSQEVSLELEARACEAHALLQKAATSTLEEFRRRVEVHIDLILADAIERATYSLASLDAESRAAIETRRRALEADVAHAGEQSTMEFRSGIKAFLYSCLVAAVSAVDQHSQTTLAGLSTDPSNLSQALDTIGGSSPRHDNPPSQSNDPSRSR